MIARLLGAAMLFCAAVAAGLCRVKSLRRRPVQLRAAADSMELLRAEICTRLTPMPDALGQVLERAPDAAPFYSSVCMSLLKGAPLQQSWEAALEELPELHARERAAMRTLAASLGRYGVSEQDRALRQCIDVLQESARRAEEKARAECALTLRLAATLGAGLVIMIW